MKKDLLGLMVVPLIAIGGLTYAVAPATYTITFLDDGVEVASGKVTGGSTRSGTVILDDRDGYEFDYRYVDGNPNSPFELTTTPITADTTLIAHWTLNEDIENGVYNTKGGDITVAWDDINMTIAGENLEGCFYWGWNEPEEDGNWSTNPTYGVEHNNDWGGGNDTYVNGFDDGSERYKRQGPCSTGYHVPSRGEWSSLIIAWCNLNNNCNPAIDLKHDSEWTEENKLIYINKPGLGTLFQNRFNIDSYDYSFWSSSPYPDDSNDAWLLYATTNSIDSNSSNRNNCHNVRCIKNYVTLPPIVHNVTFLDDGIEIASGTVIDGETRSESVTLDRKDGYEFDYRYVDGNPNSPFELATTSITTDIVLHAKWELVADIENGVYVAAGGDKTVVYNNGWYNINLTIAGQSLEGKYYWGRNEPSNNNWYINPTFGAEHNNDWGGGGDMRYDSGNERYKRQGPCPSGYHVPSAQEWSDLIIAWCSLDNDCNFDEDDYRDYGYDYGFLYDEDEIGFGTKFKEIFNIAGSEYYFWSSSPYPDDSDYSYVIDIEEESIIPAEEDIRNNGGIGVRCFRNYLSMPLANYTVNFMSDGKHIRSGAITSGYKISTDIIITKNLTGLNKTGYTFSGWVISGSDEKFDVENDVVTTGMTLNALWTPNTNTQYIVNYYQESLSGTYDIIETYTGAGTTNTQATAEQKSYSGFTFSGNHSENVITGNINGSGSLILKLYYDRNSYIISFVSDNTVIQSGSLKYGAEISTPTNPTKNGYKFIKWEPEIPTIMPAKDLTITAKWEEIQSGGGSTGGGGGGSGGGGSSSSSSSDKDKNDKTTDSSSGNTSSGTNIKNPEESSLIEEDQNENPDKKPAKSTDKSSDGLDNASTSSNEFQQAYEFAYKNGITTMPTIKKANMEGNLARIAMAKMLSQYAINILGKTPDTSKNNKFNDVSEELDASYNNGVTLAYQLGIMGQNMSNNNFRPYDEVTRAEFATALSRLLYSTSDGEYKSTSKYYVNHMEKLKKEGIITKSDPNMKELRGYVMIMLMRSARK